MSKESLQRIRFQRLVAALFALATAFGAGRAEAQACLPWGGTLDDHVAGGRATKQSSQDCSPCVFGICGFPTGCDVTSSKYYTVGSNEQIGTSGAARVTLYQTGSYTATFPPARELSCSDKLDNDCDGNVDCQDAQCEGDPACPPPNGALELKWVSVHGSSFLSGNPTNYDDAGASPRSLDWAGQMSISLPDGAVVREMRCGLNLGAPISSALAQLQYQGISGRGMDRISAVDLRFQASPATFVTARSPTVLSGVAPINNKDAAYSILIAIRHTSVPTTGYVSGCSVGYTL